MTEPKKLVSIIIPCYILDRGGNIYDERELLQITNNCLSNIRKYSNSDQFDYELILVDNASEDGISLMLEHADIYIRNSVNLGCSGGWNQGLKLASGEYIIIMNNDVFVYDGWLDGILSPLKNKNIAFSTPDILQHLSEYGGSVIHPSMYHLLNNEACILKNPEIITFFAKREDGWGSLFAARKEIYELIGNFDENFKYGMFEDRDMWVRVHDAGYKICRTQGCWVSHIGNATFGKIDDQQTVYINNRDYFHSKYPDLVRY